MTDRRIPIYLVCTKVDVYDRDGNQFYMVHEAKLTRSAAELAAERYDGGYVDKLVADKLPRANVCTTYQQG